MLAVVTQRLESSVLRVVTEVEGRLVAALRTGRLLDLDGVHSRSPLRPSGCHRPAFQLRHAGLPGDLVRDRKSTRLNSSHVRISYAVFCLKKKKKTNMILHFKKKTKEKR